MNLLKLSLAAIPAAAALWAVAAAPMRELLFLAVMVLDFSVDFSCIGTRG